MAITNLEKCCNHQALFDEGEAAKHGVKPGQILAAVLQQATVQLGAFYEPMLQAVEQDNAAGVEGSGETLAQLKAHRRQAETLYAYAGLGLGMDLVPEELAILISNLIAGMGAALETEINQNEGLRESLHSRVAELVKAINAEGPVH
jgi:hypothetical protein